MVCKQSNEVESRYLQEKVTLKVTYVKVLCKNLLSREQIPKESVSRVTKYIVLLRYLTP